MTLQQISYIGLITDFLFFIVKGKCCVSMCTFKIR